MLKTLLARTQDGAALFGHICGYELQMRRRNGLGYTKDKSLSRNHFALKTLRRAGDLCTIDSLISWRWKNTTKLFY